MARILVFILLTFGILQAALSQQGIIVLSEGERETFQTVESTVLSPFCPGRLLRDCPSTAASDLKREIKQKIKQGATAEQLERELFDQFGEEIRAAPEKKGVGLLAWLTPIVFLLLGSLLILTWIARKKRGDSEGAEHGQTPADLSESMTERIEQELERY